MSKHIIEKLIDWECTTANEESETLMEAVSHIDQLQSRITSLETALSDRTQRLASKEDALAAAMLVIDSVMPDARQLAEAVIKRHRCCLYDQNNDGDFAEPCLLDRGETCHYNKPALGQCDEYDKCQCPDCQTARRVICQNSDT